MTQRRPGRLKPSTASAAYFALLLLSASCTADFARLHPDGLLCKFGSGVYWPSVRPVAASLRGAAAPPRVPAAEQRLLAQRYAVTNWDEYYAANNYVGWVDDNTVPVCTWTGVYCNPSGAIEEL